MKKIIITTLFVILPIITQSCIMNNNFEQGKTEEIPSIFNTNNKDNTFETINNEEIKSTEKTTSINCLDTNIEVKVSYVTDGDTFSYNCKNQSYKVRIIGIDTPETKHPQKGVQCFGIEASNYMKQLISGNNVILKKGEGTSNTDKYGRLLRYVYIDTTDIGEKMIDEGYAFSYKRFPHEKLETYNETEKKAKENNTGLWNPDTCNY